MSAVATINFDEVRRHVPLPAFLQSLGCESRAEGDTYRCRCPLHHEQHGASMMLYSDGRWHCHGKCQRGGDIVDLAGEFWGLSDPREISARLLGGDIPQIHPTTPRQAFQSRPSPTPKWPPRELDQLDTIVRAGPHLCDVWERSPYRYDDSANHAEKIIDIVFPGDALLCCGIESWRFATQRRSAWRGKLHELPLIVPNPMLRVQGLTKGGKISEHSLDATAARVYLVIECDFSQHHTDGEVTEFLPLIDGWERHGITSIDACAAVLWHLKETESLPLVLGVHSGNKSFQGWFLAFDRDEEEELLPFMQRAHALGADPVTWIRSQFVRMPDGRRQNGRPQIAFYFDPQQAVSL